MEFEYFNIYDSVSAMQNVLKNQQIIDISKKKKKEIERLSILIISRIY